jgi:glycosyltransferase involved in cell wall biosynthesis
MRPETPRPELTILMPCLNEAETIATCVKKASSYLSKSNIRGEILVADNGSTDGSREIAQGLGAHNPLLSFTGRIFFKAELGDFHCGLRGFNTGAVRNLKLRSRGMEFASEMVVRCRLARMRIAEVPTTLKKDGRSHPLTCAHGEMAGGTCGSC